MSTTTGLELSESRRLNDVRLRPVSATIHVSGLALMMLAPGMIFSLLIEWGYGQHSDDEWALGISAAISFVVGFAMWFSTAPGNVMRPKDVFSVVTWTWVLSSVMGALPYLLGDMFTWQQWDLALFESVSGFSCTGSTVLSDIEANGKGILMWRQLTQWYGGMGMVVLALTVLPFLGVGGLSLMAAEAPGEGADRLAHRVSETAKRLWVVYAGLTAAIALALWLTPQVGLYDAVAHGFSTSATGGFSPRGSSIGTYDSVLVEIIVIVAMLTGGISFSIHYRALSGDARAYLRSADTMLYFQIFLFASGVVTLINWWKGVSGFWTALRHGVFNVASLITSTGFGTATAEGSAGDFVTWAPGAVMVLLLLFVIGGNAGSTAGGIKVFRFQVAMSHAFRQLRRTRHPRGIIPVKLGHAAVPDAVVNRVLGFLTLFFIMAMGAILALAAAGIPLMEAGAAVLSAMSNMGPGLGDAGPTGSFAVYPRSARLVLTVMMLVGRLELTAVVMVVSSAVSAVGRRRRRSVTD